jgi:hypothetical protein
MHVATAAIARGASMRLAHDRRTSGRLRVVVALSLGVLAACPAPRGPSAGSVASQTLEIGRAGAVLSGVAGDGATVFAALVTTGVAQGEGTIATTGSSAGATLRETATAATGSAAGATSRETATATTGNPAAATPRTTIEARKTGATSPAWHTELDGTSGPLVRSGALVVAALGGTGSVAGLALRGEPGSVVAALDASTGAIAWKVALDATDWSVVAALAATPDGVVVGGSFSGTLRIGARVVSSAGKTDGFVARLTAAGGVAWVVRLGGPGADAVQGVATAGDRIAIAGTFAAGADLLGQPLPPFDERSVAADGFVAELDAAGARRWADAFGGKADESVAGVAIDARGRIAVAATVRDTIHVGGVDLVASGPADGLVAWWAAGGTAGAQVLIGGADFDGLRAIAAAGAHIVVGGFYSGSLKLGDRAVTAAGGDDAFLAELDASGAVVESWPVSGPGREEVTALAAIPGGFVAGIAHTAAASVGSDSLPAPRDPMSGAAIVVRPVR